MLDLKIFKIRMNDTPQGDGNFILNFFNDLSCKILK